MEDATEDDDDTVDMDNHMPGQCEEVENVGKWFQQNATFEGFWLHWAIFTRQSGKGKQVTNVYPR